ncbi:hypothetical protein N9K77_00360 [bacterium]|nr:hypothetical protein [bacterium]
MAWQVLGTGSSLVFLVQESYEIGEGPIKVALIDFGVKKNIIRCLNQRGCKVKVFPYDVSLKQITNYKPREIAMIGQYFGTGIIGIHHKHILKNLYSIYLYRNFYFF